jgi:hypothetical protein
VGADYAWARVGPAAVGGRASWNGSVGCVCAQPCKGYDWLTSISTHLTPLSPSLPFLVHHIPERRGRAGGAAEAHPGQVPVRLGAPAEPGHLPASHLALLCMLPPSHAVVRCKSNQITRTRASHARTPLPQPSPRAHISGCHSGPIVERSECRPKTERCRSEAGSDT